MMLMFYVYVSFQRFTYGFVQINRIYEKKGNEYKKIQVRKRRAHRAEVCTENQKEDEEVAKAMKLYY